MKCAYCNKPGKQNPNNPHTLDGFCYGLQGSFWHWTCAKRFKAKNPDSDILYTQFPAINPTPQLQLL